MKVKVAAAVGVSLLLLAGCSTSGKEKAAPSTTTVTSTVTATSSSPSSESPTPGASKASFCREVNRAVNIRQSAGENLTETETDGMIAALQQASTDTPSDVPTDFTTVINAMLADLQAPTTKLPDSWNANADKLAQYAADYCGQS